MRTLRFQFVIAAALFAGVAIGYFARPSDAVVPDTREEAVPKRRIAEVKETADEKALRRRVSKLERALNEKNAASETAISNAVAEAVKNAPPQHPRTPHEWMENLKKNDPVKFAQMTNHFAQGRARRAERARNTVDFLSSIDTSGMSASAKKTHDELQELIARREELEEQMHQKGLSEDQHRQLHEQMHELNDEIRKLNQQERSNLLEEAAKKLGFEGQDAKDISSTIQEVIEATGGNGRGDMMMPPPDGAPGGGPGSGGPGGR